MAWEVRIELPRIQINVLSRFNSESYYDTPRAGEVDRLLSNGRWRRRWSSLRHRGTIATRTARKILSASWTWLFATVAFLQREALTGESASYVRYLVFTQPSQPQPHQPRHAQRRKGGGGGASLFVSVEAVVFFQSEYPSA